jgi:putative hemolysin
LGDRKAKSLITHKGDIVYFNISDSFELISNKINEEKHSAYPVCVDNDINHIIGLVLIKDLFSPDFRNDFELKKILKAPLFITENTSAYNILELFKNKKMHYAIVLDEYGSTKGIITMDDVLDALVGDVSEHNQSEYQIVQRDENSWLVDAQFPIVEFEKQFQIKIQDTKKSFVTVAGFFIHQFHAIPNLGDTIEIKEGFRLEIIDKDEQRIDKILLTKI